MKYYILVNENVYYCFLVINIADHDMAELAVIHGFVRYPDKHILPHGT